jgi:hypothetical protein
VAGSLLVTSDTSIIQTNLVTMIPAIVAISCIVQLADKTCSWGSGDRCHGGATSLGQPPDFSIFGIYK